MALSDSRNAIGAVGQLLQAQLIARTSAGSVDVGRVEAAKGTAGPKFNLFLYHVEVDGFLRNQPLDAGQQPPLWLVLHYLLTAFDTQSDSDSIDAHELLGEGMQALQSLSVQHPASAALADNPEPLKITFETGDAELLSKIQQGTDDRYRLCAAFQVRPVLVAATEAPSYAPLVRSVGQPEAEGVVVIPSLGPHLTELEPTRFEAGATLTLRGDELTSAVQWVCLGATCYPVTAAPAGELRAVIPANTTLAPGSYPVTVARELPNGRRLASNPLLADLQPSLATATPTLPLTDDGHGNLFGTLTLAGTHLGGPQDDIFVAFWRNGAVALMVEGTGVAAQTSVAVDVTIDDALAPGTYRIILRVNGVQAPLAPEVAWS